MPQPTTTQARLNYVAACLTTTANTLQVLADSLSTPFLGAIINTTHAVLKNIQTMKQNKDDCAQLLEETNKLLNAIIIVHIKSEVGGEMPPHVLHNIGRFTEILYKIHTFVEAQQNGNKLKSFFRHGEMNTLLKACREGLQQVLDFFQIETAMILPDVVDMQRDAQRRHQEVLNMIETLSDSTSSEEVSFMSRPYSRAYNSSNSISMLPSEPKTFHGRDSELSDVLGLFDGMAPRIAILGTAGMGKTSLARALLHHPKITASYSQNRFFVTCSSTKSKLELVALIGAHLGLKPGKDLTRPVVQYFSDNPPSLLILDELETLWEATQSRSEIEELLSLLTSVDHLALMITMRGAERPGKVRWTRPFLSPLQPLDQAAARLTFTDIADDGHDLGEVDKILSLTDNMPLAISLLAHLADSEGCSNVLSRWEKEKTSLISDGFDKRSNLDLSISMSLSSPRINSLLHSRDLLSLLSMLPDGLLDVDLIQSKLPLENILSCTTVLKSTALAYSDESKRLKVLMPIREYIQRHLPTPDHFVQNLHKYFQELLEFYIEYTGTRSNSSTVRWIISNFANIQNVLQWGLQQGQPGLVDSVYCICHLNRLSRLSSHTHTHLISQAHNTLSQLSDHRVHVYVITELLGSWHYHRISDPEALIARGLEHIVHFNDPSVKCPFYSGAAHYYYEFKHDLSEAANMCKIALSIGVSAGYIKGQAGPLVILAWIEVLRGQSFEAQLYAHQSQRLARISGDLFTEAQAIRIEAIFWAEFGHYKKSLALCSRARDLLGLCEMSASSTALSIITTQAVLHEYKSEYTEARNTYMWMLQNVSLSNDMFWHAMATLNVAKVELSMGLPKDNVQSNIDIARSIFTTLGLKTWLITCDTQLAELHLREKDHTAAKLLFEKCLEADLNSDVKSFCLERLGNASRWGAGYSMFMWTTIFLVHSLQFKKKLAVHKALQYFGDLFLYQGDEDTATSLFTVSLEGFTVMDIHCSRAECMMRLSDISTAHGDLLRAMELWETARPLFECSSQAKQVEDIDDRLASVSQGVKLQYSRKLAELVELNAQIADVAYIADAGNEVRDKNRVADVVVAI